MNYIVQTSAFRFLKFVACLINNQLPPSASYGRVQIDHDHTDRHGDLPEAYSKSSVFERIRVGSGKRIEIYPFSWINLSGYMCILVWT